MNLPAFSFQPATLSRPGSALRLPQAITATTGCALSFRAVRVVELPMAAVAPSVAPRRSSRDVHQSSYYAQCRVAMGY